MDELVWLSFLDTAICSENTTKGRPGFAGYSSKYFFDLVEDLEKSGHVSVFFVSSKISRTAETNVRVRWKVDMFFKKSRKSWVLKKIPTFQRTRAYTSAVLEILPETKNTLNLFCRAWSNFSKSSTILKKYLKLRKFYFKMFRNFFVFSRKNHQNCRMLTFGRRALHIVNQQWLTAMFFLPMRKAVFALLK